MIASRAQITASKRSPHERRKSDVSDLRKLTMAELGNTRVRKSDVSDLRKLTMAELGNTRVLRKCGICLEKPGLRFAPSGLRLLRSSAPRAEPRVDIALHNTTN